MINLKLLCNCSNVGNKLLEKSTLSNGHALGGFLLVALVLVHIFYTIGIDKLTSSFVRHFSKWGIVGLLPMRRELIELGGQVIRQSY